MGLRELQRRLQNTCIVCRAIKGTILGLGTILDSLLTDPFILVTLKCILLLIEHFLNVGVLDSWGGISLTKLRNLRQILSYFTSRYSCNLFLSYSHFKTKLKNEVKNHELLRQKLRCIQMYALFKITVFQLQCASIRTAFLKTAPTPNLSLLIHATKITIHVSRKTRVVDNGNCATHIMRRKTRSFAPHFMLKPRLLGRKVLVQTRCYWSVYNVWSSYYE